MWKSKKILEPILGFTSILLDDTIKVEQTFSLTNGCTLSGASMGGGANMANYQEHPGTCTSEVFSSEQNTNTIFEVSVSF